MKTLTRVSILCAFAMSIAACTSNQPCRPKTLLVELKLGVAAQAADEISVDFSLGGQTLRSYVVGRLADAEPFYFAIELGKSYEVGKSYSLRVLVKQGAAVIGEVSKTDTLTGSCTAASLTLDPVDAGTDIDQAGAPKDDLATDGATVIDLATPSDPDLAGPDLIGADLTPPFSTPVCNATGWCWEQPSPSGNTLNKVWAASVSDVWVVGEAGIILHYDGSRWSQQASGVDVTLFDVWGTSPSNVWAVGARGTVIQYNGSSWNPVTVGTVADTFSAIHGSSADDVWIAGFDATDNLVVHWDGNDWNESFRVAITDFAFNRIWAAGPSDVWVAEQNCYRWDGVSWNVVPQSELLSLWGSGPTDVWIGNTNGNVRRWTGSTWVDVTLPVEFNNLMVVNIWGTANNDVWVFPGVPLHWNGSDWTKSTLFSNEMLVAASIGGTIDEQWIVLGDKQSGQILHKSGAAEWTGFQRRSEVTLNAVTIVGEGDAWTVGNGGLIEHWDGNSWTVVDGGVVANLFGVWASGPNDVWAVGGGGTIIRWNGSAWNFVSSTNPQTLRAIWGTGPNNIWAVGDAGAVIHWNGAEWAIVSSSTSSALYSVSGSAINDVWAVGANGASIRWNGTTWTSVSTGSSALLESVCAQSASTAYAVGGAYLRFSGGVWAPIATTDSDVRRLRSVVCPLSGGIPAVGDYGRIAIWNGVAWVNESPITGRKLNGLAKTATKWIAVGDYSTIVAR